MISVLKLSYDFPSKNTYSSLCSTDRQAVPGFSGLLSQKFHDFSRLSRMSFSNFPDFFHICPAVFNGPMNLLGICSEKEGPKTMRVEKFPKQTKNFLIFLGFFTSIQFSDFSRFPGFSRLLRPMITQTEICNYRDLVYTRDIYRDKNLWG